MKKVMILCALVCARAAVGHCSTLVGNPEIVARVVPPAGWTIQSATVHLAAVDLDDCAAGQSTVTVPSTVDWRVSPVWFTTGEWCQVAMRDVDIDVVATVNGDTVSWSWSGDLVAADPDVLDIVTGTNNPVVMKITVGTPSPTAWLSLP